MSENNSAREFDVVVYGATGFTGRLVAEYLARNAPTLRWALAGRSATKLEAVRRAVAEVDPRCASVGVIVASTDDRGALDAMAARTRVLLTTVGPFARLGHDTVAACVDAGTDYVDITGEPDFVADTIQRHHLRAAERGLRVVNCCGFDSVPHDLGAYMLMRHLAPEGPLEIDAFVRSSASFSGGTWHSALEYMAKRQSVRLPLAPHAGRAIKTRAKLHREAELNAWAAPLPTIDPQIVLRSASLLPGYGPSFTYGHFAQVRAASTLVVGAVGIGAVALLAQFGPTRALLGKVRGSGEGPSAEERARAWFTVTLRARAGGRTVMGRVSGRDPGYDETAKMLAESALSLALDRDALPAVYGVVTPAAAMGDALLARLRAAGMRFEILSDSGA